MKIEKETLSRIASLRMQNQHLSNASFSSPKEIVSWMGAMQAQDYVMAKWAIGCRLISATDLLIEKAIAAGDIVRTHLLRPTWHFVAAEDLTWLLQLTAPQVKAAMRSNDKRLGITEETFSKTNRLIAKILEANEFAPRVLIQSSLEKSKIPTGENRLAHYLMRAELDGIACNGPTINKERTYALIDKWITRKKQITGEEALVELVNRYFQSHGPASIKDFCWWSGLPITQAKTGIEACGNELEQLVLSDTFYYYKLKPNNPVSPANTLRMLAGYDEFIIGYSDRSAVLRNDYNRQVISTNGIFKPVIIDKNKVVGLWNKTIANNKIVIGFDFFNPAKAQRVKIKKEVKALQLFYNIPQVQVPDSW